MAYLNEVGVQFLVQQLLGVVETKTTSKVSSTINASSTNQQIAGAKAVYDFITGAVSGKVNLEFQVVETLPTTGASNIIYLLTVDANTYQQNLYIGGQWYDLGPMEATLSDYWAKTELVAMTDAEIQAIIDSVMEA